MNRFMVYHMKASYEPKSEEKKAQKCPYTTNNTDLSKTPELMMPSGSGLSQDSKHTAEEVKPGLMRTSSTNGSLDSNNSPKKEDKKSNKSSSIKSLIQIPLSRSLSYKV